MLIYCQQFFFSRKFGAVVHTGIACWQIIKDFFVYKLITRHNYLYLVDNKNVTV